MADTVVSREFEIIGGVRHEVGSDAHRDARVRHDAATAQIAVELKTAKDLAAAEKLRADAATVKLDQVVAGAAKELSPERMDARAAARAAVVEIGRSVLGKEWKADGLSNRAIKVAVLNKANGLRLDAADEKLLSPDMLTGMWTMFKAGRDASAGNAGERQQRHDDLMREIGGRGNGGGNGGQTMRSSHEIRLDAMEESEGRWQRPLAISSRSTPVGSEPQPQSSMMENQR